MYLSKSCIENFWAKLAIKNGCVFTERKVKSVIGFEETWFKGENGIALIDALNFQINFPVPQPPCRQVVSTHLGKKVVPLFHWRMPDSIQLGDT